MTIKISLRIDPNNPNHHLWNNQGTWWIHCTLHRFDHTAHRLRRSLQTRCIEEARKRRDQLLAALAAEAEANRSIQSAETATVAR
jgi:hypothetical protein